jgi:hypothetical protein
MILPNNDYTNNRNQPHYSSGINNIYSDPYETYKRGLDGTEYKSVQSAQSDRKVKNKRDFNFNV